MEIKPVYAVVALAVVFVGLLAFSMQAPATPPAGPNLSAEASELYLRGVGYGMNASSYIYSYTEYSNDFPENYTLASDGKNSYVDVLSVLSWKRVYFLENDTILCINFQGAEACSSVKNESTAKSFTAAMKGKLFNDDSIRIALLNARYKINRSLLVFEPVITSRVLPNGRSCKEIRYMENYSGATLAESSRFGIGSGNPQLFRDVSCIGNSGEFEQFYYNYTSQGQFRELGQSLISSDLNAKPSVSPPEELNQSAITLEIAYTESSYRSDLVTKCFYGLPEGENRSSCVQKFAAVTLKQIDLCELAGSQRDRCRVALVPYLKDPSICTGIESPEYKDNCYIELAGAFKNASWCEYVNDLANKTFCLQVANPLAEQPEEQGEQQSATGSGNESGASNESVSVPTDVSRIFGNLELEENATSNSTKTAGANNTNSSG